MGYVPTLLAGKIQSNPEVVSKKIANNVATLTLATKPVMIAGQRIVVSNLGSPFDGTYTVSAVDRSANTVSYARTSGDTGPTAVTHAPKKVTYRKLENGIATLTVESITYDVTFRQRTGTTVTLTTSGNHTFNSGDQVTVASLIGAGFNGTYTLTGVTSNTVTYTSGTSGNVSTADTGTIRLNAAESIEIDNYNRQVSVTAGSGEVVTVGARAYLETLTDWIYLQPGNNTLVFNDSGASAATLDVYYRSGWIG
jgi:predicted aspartyl protease